MPKVSHNHYNYTMLQNTSKGIDLSYAIGLPPEKAIEYFASKGYEITFDWKSTWENARTKAFTIAGVTKMDILQTVKNEIDKALQTGTSLQTFKENLIPRLQALGWLSSTPEKIPYRLETIYRTNMQTAFMAGRYREMMENVEDRPYWQYVAVMDSRTRPAHAALNGKVFRYDDPFWKTHYPPAGFGCRCRVRALSEEDIKRRKLTVESGENNIIWEEKPVGGGYTRPTAAYVDPETGAKLFTDPGWSYNPGETFWEPDLRRYHKDIRAAFEKEMAEFKASLSPIIPQGIIQRLNIEVKSMGDINAILKELEKENPDLFANGFNGISYVYRDYFMAAYNSTGRIEVSGKTFPNCSNFSPRKDLIAAINKIRKQQSLTFNEEYAIESLWHEILHLRVKEYVRFMRDSARQICMETVNQFVARHTYDSFLNQLGGLAAHKNNIIENGYGYSGWVKNFRRLIEKIGIDETAVAPKLERQIAATYRDITENTTRILVRESIKNTKFKTLSEMKTAYRKNNNRVREALYYLEKKHEDFNNELDRIWREI